MNISRCQVFIVKSSFVPTSIPQGVLHAIPGACVVAILFCILLFSTSYCQPKLLQFKHLTVADGLSSSIVVSVVQDYKGFMWLGTYEGLNRYDGAAMVVYKNIPSDSTSLPSDLVRSIFEDRRKNLFVGTAGGLAQYNRDLDCFKNFRYDTASALFGNKSLVLRITEDTIGNLWLATENGLIYFDRLNNKISTYQHDPSNPGTICDSYVDVVYFDKTGRLWVATPKGLDLFNPQTREFKHIKICKTHNDTIASIYFLSIAEGIDGNIWFGSSDGLFCLEGQHPTDDFELTHFRNDPADEGSLSNNRAKSLLVDREGKLWIGTENGGINLFDPKTKKFSKYRKDDFNLMSLNNESIHSIAQDRNDNLWFGTWGSGVNLSVKNSDFIVHDKNLPGAAQSLSCNIVSGFVEDRKNRFWIGTDGGGFNLLDDKTNRFTRFSTENLDIKSNAIICIAAGDNTQIWLGTWEGGLVRYDYSDNTTKSFTTQNSPILENNIFAIAKDTLGNLWLGTMGHGLLYYALKEGACHSYTTENSAISHNKITLIRLSRNGHVYLGSTSGFQIFSPIEKTFETFENDINNLNSLSNNNVNDIFIDNDTCVWICTQKGLNMFNPATKKIMRCTTEDSLQNKSIQGLTKDKYGALWMTTNAGITRFDYRKNTTKNLKASDGLQSTDFKNASILTTEDGTILAGGTNGFNIINPEKIPENKTAPPVVLTDLHIFNQQVIIGAEGSPLKKHISQTSSLTLTYKQSVLTFFFAALDFTNPSKNQYAYMMENFDKAWTYCGNRKDATYTNLNPGKYLFHIRGSNNDGVWNETGTSLEIVITPPWWQTKTARIGFVISVICLFLGIYFYRINQLNRQKNVLEKLVQQRTHEIEEKNQALLEQTKELKETNLVLAEQQHYIDAQTKELSASNEKLVSLNVTKDKLFSIIAHDLKNPFASILGIHENLARRYDTMNDSKRKHMFEIVYDSSKKIFKLLETLLDWARTQTGNVNFNPEEFALNDIIADTIVVVENLAREKKIEIKQCLSNKVTISADRNMVNTVIRNLVTNAIKFTENGTITIEADQSADASTIRIIDSGVGIIPEKAATLFNSINSKSSFGTRGESGTGLGLIICKEFIERHGGSIAVESEIGRGSTFYFTIPNKNASTTGNRQSN
jgi:signal transduction histidine kinase/ligand-binding sensor domain-containing protein